MNKKLILLLALFVSALAVMGVEVFGSLPESRDLPSIEAITIPESEYDRLTEDGNYLKVVDDIVTEQTPRMEFAFSIDPMPSRHNLTVRTTHDGVSADIDDINMMVYVYFDLSALGEVVTIQIRDRESGRRVELVLWFDGADEVDVPGF